MSNGQKLIIIVDDDQAVRDSLQFALRLEGLCVHVHGGAAALLADPALSRAGCVILDHRMPQLDGFALFNTVQERNPHLPAILLTSHATPRVRARANAAGVRTVLEKPLLENVLIDNIRSILN
ncbi:MAG TPA: response regulator [Acetobacteraceae bacterium]|jgi:two-component system, LuxR family, response regulator FixJ|nr:response regulator [Acetobacteraceae bacterium]